MSAHFRIIYFVPDPFSGMRVPLAALVADDSRRVHVVRAPFTPGVSCVGGLAAWHTMQMVLEDLGGETSSFDMLPASLGPHVELAPQKEIPASVVAPLTWVEQVVLPHRPSAPEDQRETAPHAPRLETVGNRFFQTWRVGNYVHKHFKGEPLGLSAEYAGQITHFVPGRQELLLMEPVVGTRGDLRKDLREISQTFLAWSKLFDRSTIRLAPRFFAYVVSGSHASLSEAREILSMAQAEVINVENPDERDGFLNEIRRVGRTGPEQGGLPVN